MHEIQPLERLKVQNGLLINAEKWQRSHNYHRQRQNIHYQSLNQPGIVYGLGVCLIPAPQGVSSQYDDKRWLQIQPGLAIDTHGNPIIVPEAIDFHIAADIAEDQPRLIYLVISYVDPDDLQRQTSGEFEQETFRLEEKTTPPDIYEVELCRILLQPGLMPLQNPQDVFEPELNSLDYRYRPIARSRHSAVVRVAYLETTAPEVINSFENFGYLLKSAEHLTQTMQGFETVDRIQHIDQANIYDLLFTTGEQPFSLSTQELTNLKSYLDTGGVLLVESPTDAIDRLESIVDIADKFNTPLEDLRKLDRNHPMRTHPFLFAALPVINHKPIQVLIAGGIILVIGDLSTAWGLDEKLTLPRETIRTAQELGINILHFAWSRKQMTQLQKIPILPTQNTPSPSYKPDPLQSIFKKIGE